MTYESVLVQRRGGPEVLDVVENELRAPAAGEVRVRVSAAPVSRPDVEARYGHSPFAPGRLPFTPDLPFTPGYAVVGTVDAVGTGVTRTATGHRVAALTVFGGYSEYVYAAEEDLIPVPASVDPVAAAPVVLNYLVAYQALHRSAGVEPGDVVLVVGASGGVGTAFLQLAELAELKVYGVASAEKHDVLREYGATPIDYRTRDFAAVVREAEPDGVDAVFDGIGGENVERAFSLLRPGGTYVGFANPGTCEGWLDCSGRSSGYGSRGTDARPPCTGRGGTG